MLKILADKIIDGVVHRTCPHCEKTKPLNDFGLRRMQSPHPGEPPTVTNQSWCRLCRRR